MGKRRKGEKQAEGLESFFRNAAMSAKVSMHYIGKNLENVDAELEDAILEHDKSHKRLMETLRDAQQTVQKESGRANQSFRDLDKALRSKQ